MHEHIVFLLAAFLILLFGLVSKVSDKFYVTAPMFFTVVGILVSPLGFGLLDVHINAAMIKTLAEITLVLVLFSDAIEIELSDLRKHGASIPLRMLGIGLPLTALLGFLLGIVLFDNLDLIVIAMIALILSPTDAALGQAVIKSEKLPETVKRSISVESGLNDGIALPPILVCMALLSATIESSGDDNHWLKFLLLQLTLGPVVGAAVGWFGGRLIEYASSKDWMSPVFQRLSAMSLAVLAFAFAEMVHGNGFIAAFIAGLFLGVKNHQVRERIQEFGEAEGQQLALFIFLVLGLVAVPVAYPLWDANAIIYAILSLTIIRMLPVALSLLGTNTGLADKLFYGWFGPRGIASVLYLLMVVGTLGVASYEYALSIIVLTILMSIILHGLSAVPLVNVYSKRINDGLVNSN